jgi:3-isopropylmalate/(R)-2-methylmalate dehydratase small subunit
VVKFDIDPDIKHRLLNGLDDVAITLQDAEAIDRYESSAPWPGPSTTSL